MKVGIHRLLKKYTMKTNQLFSFCMLLLAALTFPTLSYAQGSGDAYRTDNFTVSGNVNFEAETSGSSVKVVGGSGNQIVVTMYAKISGDKVSYPNDRVEEFLEDYRVEIEQNGNTVTLTAKGKSGSWWSWDDNKVNLYFEVAVPENTSTSFQTSGGAISIDRLSGSHDIATSGGSIKVSNSSGEVYTQSSGGSFSLSRFEGDATVKTSGGSVKISDLIGDIEISTSGGSVSLEDIDGSISANTSGGSIRANLVAVEDDLSFKSSGGSISVTVPEDIGLDLNMRGGRVNSTMRNFSGSIDKDRVVGELNGGGYELLVQSSGGRVSLDFSDRP